MYLDAAIGVEQGRPLFFDELLNHRHPPKVELAAREATR